MKAVIPNQRRNITDIVPAAAPPNYLSEAQLNALTTAYQWWYDDAKTPASRCIRGRYWLAYLIMRFTGARLGEVLSLDDTLDIDYRNHEIRMPTLKRRKQTSRQVFLPAQVIAETATYLADHPNMRGKIFRLDQSNVRKVFLERCKDAGLPRNMAHPHILRHTRAIEMLRAGVPITVVQDQLGHAQLTTTAVYLKISGQEAKGILRDKGLL